MSRDNSFEGFASRLRERMISWANTRTTRSALPPFDVTDWEAEFNEDAIELFTLQFEHNAAYRRLCEARAMTPQTIRDWSQIPHVPTSAFKELELSCIPKDERTRVFFSSGTTEHRPSRHFHHDGSLAVYETSLRCWFMTSWMRPGSPKHVRGLSLTPAPAQAPNSSLVHMFEVLRQRLEIPDFNFSGEVDTDGSWTLNCAATLQALNEAVVTGDSLLLLGTAFSYVHLLDFLAARDLTFRLPFGSRILETGGYKNRSRALPKSELHSWLTNRLGVPRSHIICEYGMSELSSQAYDTHDTPNAARCFRFPPWAKAQLVSPENGRPVSENETGLIRVCDLANVYSVLSIQTEDLAVRRGAGFELAGRAVSAEPRGCSLMATGQSCSA